MVPFGPWAGLHRCEGARGGESTAPPFDPTPATSRLSQNVPVSIVRNTYNAHREPSGLRRHRGAWDLSTAPVRGVAASAQRADGLRPAGARRYTQGKGVIYDFPQCLGDASRNQALRTPRDLRGTIVRNTYNAHRRLNVSSPTLRVSFLPSGRTTVSVLPLSEASTKPIRMCAPEGRMVR